MKKLLIIGSIVGVLAVGGYLYYRKQIELMTQMKYQFLKVGLKTASLSTVEMTVSLMVTSTSTLEAEITELNLDVYIEGKKVATINELKPIIVPAKGSSIVDLKVSFSPIEIGQNLVSLAATYFKEKDALVSINGFGKIKSAFIRTSLPFEYQTTLKEIMA